MGGADLAGPSERYVPDIMHFFSPYLRSIVWQPFPFNVVNPGLL